jgi:hypothetical protein
MALEGHCRVMVVNPTVKWSMCGSTTSTGRIGISQTTHQEAAMPFQSRRCSLGRKPMLLAAAPAGGAASLIAPTSASALDPVVGPIDATTGFPSYVADNAGTRLDLCLDSPFCLGTKAELTPPDGEAFWWNSEATMPTSGGSALMVLAVEAAYGGGAGTESAFSRVRFRIDLAKGGTYTVRYPYGSKTYTVNAGGKRAINDTVDVGCISAGTFDPCTRERFGFVAQGPITNYLRWDPDAVQAAPTGFLGDANTPHRVVGGTAGNVFRVEGPDVGGPGVNFVEQNLLTVQGRLASAPDVPPPTDQVPPGVPGGLSATGVSSTQINLTWTAVSGAVRYRVYRDGVPTVAAETTSPSFADLGLTPATSHSYQVTAVDGVGNESARSAVVQAQTAPAAGVAAAVVSPTSLRFGNVRVGVPRTLPTTVRNVGTAPLRFTGITLSGGASATRYSTAGTCSTATPVQPGGSCTVRVTFRPTNRTRSLATLNIVGPNGNDTVTLSGRGN